MTFVIMVMEVFDMTIGKKILELRTQKKLTQKQLADICGFSQSALNLWENEKRQPKVEQLRKIAAALGVYISDLVDDWGNFSQEEILSDFGKDTVHGLAEKMIEKLKSIEDENGMLDEKLFEKEFDSIMEITQNASSASKAFHTAQMNQCIKEMTALLLKLNSSGKKEALKRVDELTRLSEYMGVDLGAILSPGDTPPQS